MLALTLHGHTEYLPEADREDAMKRYWQARQAGDATAQLIKLDAVPPQLLKPAEDDEDDPEDPPPAATPAGVVSPVAALRIATQDTWLTQAGFSLPPALYAPGTRVTALGEENFRAERKRVAEMPRFIAAADTIIDRIGNECRLDRTVSLQSLSMNDRGRLVTDGVSYGLEVSAFYQLSVLCGFNVGYRYLRDRCDAPLRAHNVNAQLKGLRNRRLTLRTRQGPRHSRQIFAVVTPSYVAVDTDQVLRTVKDDLKDAHTELVYRDGVGVSATALWMPDRVVDLAAGDVFKVGVRIETNDTGRGRIRISGVVFRNQCLNLIIIAEGEVTTVAQVHRGDPERILATVKDGVKTAREKIGQFLTAWGHARTITVQPEDTFRGWLKTRRLTVPGVKSAEQRDELVQVLLDSWRKEPGNTLADCVNAVTRAAHEHDGFGLDIREAFERQAANLILVPR